MEGKRKAIVLDSDDDCIEVKGVKVAKKEKDESDAKPAKKGASAAGATSKGKEDKPVKAKKAPPTRNLEKKPYTKEELKLIKEASLERNQRVIDLVAGWGDELHQAAECVP
jgi:hypothetical protein